METCNVIVRIAARLRCREESKIAEVDSRQVGGVFVSCPCVGQSNATNKCNVSTDAYYKIDSATEAMYETSRFRQVVIVQEKDR